MSLFTYFFYRPAGGSFEVQAAIEQANTNFSFNGKFASDYLNGADYPSDNPVRTTLSSKKFFFLTFEPYSTIIRTWRKVVVLELQIVCSSPFRVVVILQFPPSVHTQNLSMAAGTALAISYKVLDFPSLPLTFF